ncbi:MAG: cupin domain-containing protein [Anaerolineae bacterium]|nr:cupin domain-containing protein [Anaerolineae bacterium]
MDPLTDLISLLRLQTALLGSLLGTPQVIGGLFLCDPANVALLTGLLPPTIHIQSSAGITDRLRSIIAMIVEEVNSEWLGQELILSRLVEIMLIEALRRQSSEQKPPIKGLLAGPTDPQLALALRQIHANDKRFVSPVKHLA